MKKKNKGIIVGSSILAGAFAAANGALLYQVMNKNAKILEKINAKTYEKEKSKSKNALPQEIIENKLKFDFAAAREWYDTYEREEIVLCTRDLRLSGYFYPSEKPSDVYVFCAHGYRSNGRCDFTALAKFYHDCGFNVLVVDHQASGNSEGKSYSFGYYEKLDSMKWLEYLMDRFGEDIKFILHGISMGGATVLMMSNDEKLPDNVKMIVSDCSYSDLSKLFESILHNFHAPAKPFIKVSGLLNRMFYKYKFSDVRPIENVASSKVPILFIHGRNDNLIEARMSYELYNACSSEKDLLIVDNADHAESFMTDPENYCKKINEFSEQYL